MSAAQPALPGLGPEVCPVCPECGAPWAGHGAVETDGPDGLAFAARRLRAVETVSVAGDRL